MSEAIWRDKIIFWFVVYYPIRNQFVHFIYIRIRKKHRL